MVYTPSVFGKRSRKFQRYQAAAPYLGWVRGRGGDGRGIKAGMEARMEADVFLVSETQAIEDMAWSFMWFSFKQGIGFDSRNQYGYKS